MVVIHYKKTDVDQFLYECRTTDTNDKVIRELVGTHVGNQGSNTSDFHLILIDLTYVACSVKL